MGGEDDHEKEMAGLRFNTVITETQGNQGPAIWHTDGFRVPSRFRNTNALMPSTQDEDMVVPAKYAPMQVAVTSAVGKLPPKLERANNAQSSQVGAIPYLTAQLTMAKFAKEDEDDEEMSSVSSGASDGGGEEFPKAPKPRQAGYQSGLFKGKVLADRFVLTQRNRTGPQKNSGPRPQTTPTSPQSEPCRL